MRAKKQRTEYKDKQKTQKDIKMKRRTKGQKIKGEQENRKQEERLIWWDINNKMRTRDKITQQYTNVKMDIEGQRRIQQTCQWAFHLIELNAITKGTALCNAVTNH